SMFIKRLRIWLSSLLAFLFLSCAPAFGQSPQGTITGAVSDTQGALVPNATVTAVQVGTNQKFTAVSSSDGVYAIPSLPVGEYERTGSAGGFSTLKQFKATLKVGKRLRLDVTSGVGDVPNTVTVTTEVSRAQTEAPSLGTTVERERIQTLP